MLQVTKMLYPLELSKISYKVAPWAELMAQQFGAELHVLHVVPGLEFWGVAFASEVLIEKDMPQVIAKTQPLVEDFCFEHFKSVPPKAVKVVSGSPSAEIIKYVNENGINMIVMGTHGYYGFDRHLFGSVADKVTRTSPVPVLMVPPLVP